MNKWTNGRQTDEKMDRFKYGLTDKQMKKWTDRNTDEWTYRHINRQTFKTMDL